MAETIFKADLAAPDALSDASIDAALDVMRDGRLFRYGEVAGGGKPAAALLEAEFAALMGGKYCAAVNSGGCAIFIALKAAGVAPGDKVLLNAFTLAPVPGAIAHAGATPVLVEINDRLTIDVDDLAAKAEASGAKFLLLSHMRGHMSDMDAVATICARRGVRLIEDCAHTMGSDWDGRLAGRWGAAGCFSAQSFKHVNGGEGGLIVTDDEDLAARAILLSGSYMLYEQHQARPPMAAFERWRYETPNLSMRMNGLVAALLRPQLGELSERAARWRAVYDRVAGGLAGAQHIRLPEKPEKEGFSPTSVQFTFEGFDEAAIRAALAAAARRGVMIKWFGAEEPVGFTSRADHWRYIGERQALPRTEAILARLCDVRLPAWLSEAECDDLAAAIREAVDEAAG
ncbi:MAG: aminotransferase class I/II-fold pyridoxal phosphate-dependent enzyme [Pseudomonadota bacterium]